jgi:Pentapeptide repeats (8 copies)
MQIHVTRERPERWSERRARVTHGWAVPFVWTEHGMDWIAYGLSRWRFLDVLDYVGRFGVLVAVAFYFAESGDRLKQKHYQAWQLINSAQGKGGNGGRIEALEELNADGVSLVGVDLSSAFLHGVRLKKAMVARANFDAADAREAELAGANLENASLRGANFRMATLEGADLRGSTLDDGDFADARLVGADLTGASMENVDLRGADLQGAKWKDLRSVKGTNVLDLKNAPPGFLEWAAAHGAVRKTAE